MYPSLHQTREDEKCYSGVDDGIAGSLRTIALDDENG
jgi:hypothetical protein